MIKTDHLSHTYEDEDGKVVYLSQNMAMVSFINQNLI